MEQRDCAHEPKPYYCDGTAFNMSAFSSFADELRSLKPAGAPLNAMMASSRKAFIKHERHNRQNIDQLFQRRQQRAHCSNWCHSPFPASRREQRCHDRAEKMFLKVAAHAKPTTDSTSLALSPPPPFPPLAARTRPAYRRWKQAQELQAPPPEEKDMQRWRFALSFPAPADY